MGGGRGAVVGEGVGGGGAKETFDWLSHDQNCGLANTDVSAQLLVQLRRGPNSAALCTVCVCMCVCVRASESVSDC